MELHVKDQLLMELTKLYKMREPIMKWVSLMLLLAGVSCRLAPLLWGKNKTRKERVYLETTCQICSENYVEVIFVPCYHAIVCSDCSRKIKNCLICRRHIAYKSWVDEQINTN